MHKKALIIDDEKLARDRIRRFIHNLGYAFTVSEATSGLEGLQKIDQEGPDLVFLDIQMPGLTGIEMLQQVEKRSFKLVFQTAYDEFAIQAFEENACDYLLKPFDQNRFKRAVDRAVSDIEKIEALEESYRQKEGALKRLTIRQNGKIHLLDIDDVFCFVSKDHYTTIYTANSEYVTELSLTHLEKHLCPNEFIRCHRNNIVRFSVVRVIGTGGNMSVELGNGMSLPVSRNNREKVKRRLI